MIKSRYLLLIVVLLLVSCNRESAVEQAIEEIDISVQIDRFDLAFGKATPEDLPRLKRDYPFLFPERFHDSVWVNMMRDTINQELHAEVKKAFPVMQEEAEDIAHLFKHFKYYFPGFEAPRVVGITSEVDYKNKVVVSDSLMLIALDTYLGEDHFFYDGLQVFLKKNFKSEMLLSDIAGSYARQLVPKPKGRTFLEQMLYYGKQLYLKDLVIPHTKEAYRIGYTLDEMQWAHNNEAQIWKYFLQKELLYDTDVQLRERFINIAPFSKFYLQLDQESPPQLGQYIGWQIVRQFAEKHPDISLKQVLQLPAQKLFQESNYKPRKPE
ncbi:gliding motility lipoprotein GldB [Mesonia sediminis]|uniref:Gliding motility lipoprotein GldB n=1 Tax=Mesonia sediminis TaxID=1703946 RepID=A0ABW5SGJ0_9FLAO